MKLVFALLFTAVLAVPLFGSSLSSLYERTKYYNHYGRAIKELEAKSKSKKTKAKAKEKYKKKIAKLKRDHEAEIKADKEILLKKKAEFERMQKDPDRYNPEVVQKGIDKCVSDLAKLEAFAQYKDYDPDEAKKGADARKDAKAAPKKAPATDEEAESTGDSPF